MKAFAELYTLLDQTTKTNEKVNFMVDYFKRADPVDAIWSIALLTGRRPKRPIKTTDLKTWANELAGTPSWLFEECYNVVGDLGETISLLIPKYNSGSDKALHQIMLEILHVHEKSDAEKKTWLFGYWKLFTKNELFVFNKLMSGSFRVGVSQQLVFKALGKTYSIDEKIIAHRLMGSWLPQTHTISSLLLDHHGASDHSQPYPFYLAYPLDIPFSEMGPIDDWQIERKYDGIRGQLIIRNQESHIWSRGEELMSEKFIEFEPLKNSLPDGTVLDGEVLPFKDGRILSFNDMQKRVSRKNISKKILQEVPLCMMCYDLLEYRKQDIRHLPLLERRRLLENVLDEYPSPMLKISPLLPCDDWQELDRLRTESKLLGCEGLMLKHKASVYETGRRRGKWWKWKVEPYTVDAVMIYAQSGHGRRANLFTDYTFAIWDKNELVPFAKAYSGLTDKEILEVDHWVKRNTIEKFGPVRSVKPELVFEIAFEGINASPRHKSGIALRFPRIARWRKDKKVEDANTKDDLLQLLNSV